MRGRMRRVSQLYSPDLRSCFSRLNSCFHMWRYGNVTIGRKRRAGSRKELGGETASKEIGRHYRRTIHTWLDTGGGGGEHANILEMYQFFLSFRQ